MIVWPTFGFLFSAEFFWVSYISFAPNLSLVHKKYYKLRFDIVLTQVDRLVKERKVGHKAIQIIQK